MHMNSQMILIKHGFFQVIIFIMKLKLGTSKITMTRLNFNFTLNFLKWNRMR